jgi:hypothetical protein
MANAAEVIHGYTKAIAAMTEMIDEAVYIRRALLNSGLSEEFPVCAQLDRIAGEFALQREQFECELQNATKEAA